jgi:5-dehydro-2-deoxygluconokinase
MTIARAIRRLYAIGIYPDWWKLEPSPDPAAWRQIEAAILDNDPRCRGVLLLGQSAPIPELLASFRAAAPFGMIKGFAVGRTIFHDVAREWFGGGVDDEAAVLAMSSRLRSLAEAWRAARREVGEAA